MAKSSPVITTELRQKPFGSTPDRSVTDELARIDAEAQQTAFDASLEAQDAAEADRIGVDVETWRKLPEDVRERLSMAGMPVQSGKIVEVADELNDEGALSGVAGKTYFDNLVRKLAAEEDPRHYILMCDPPVEMTINGVKRLYHPSTSKVPRRAMADRLKDGFTQFPKYPFLPPPTEACPITDAAVFGFASKPCPYKGYEGSDDVEIHMKFAHPVEFEMREKRLERQKAELQIEIQREQLRLARIQADAAERAAGKAA